MTDTRTASLPAVKRSTVLENVRKWRVGHGLEKPQRQPFQKRPLTSMAAAINKGVRHAS